jgi:hypothetical protein
MLGFAGQGPSLLVAQTEPATLKGKVTDQTGAVIPQAAVTVTTPDGKTAANATTGPEGAFQILSLPAGTYTISVSAPGFAPYRQDNVSIQNGKAQSLTFELQIQTQEEKVQVESEKGTELDVSSSSNAGAVILKGKDLDALSDDPDELQSELQALAGPSAGPNGGQIYIDGFTGGQLPPKSSIREIRVNQNPFSAQYDKLGYGRIEILTKPGTDKFHGQFMFNDNNSIFNSRNPYVGVKPSYNTEIFDGNFGGPITKKASFFLDAQRRNINEFAAINAVVLDSSLNQTAFIGSIASPRTRSNISPRFDFQITQNNTLTGRYQLSHDTDQNSGLNQFSLPSQAYNSIETEHELQVSDSQVLSPNVVNETRFQFQRDINHQLPVSTLPTIQVQGAFSSGENTQGTVRNSQNNYELQNYTSVVHRNHLIKFGARMRGLTESSFSQPNFSGTFVFSPLFSNGQLVSTAIDVYQQMRQCQQNGGSNCATASQFSIVSGNPQINLNWFDAGLYAEDEWRVRPNLSLTYGLRFESQNNIHDRADWAPRVGVAWGLGSDGKSPPKIVLRAGFGIFYDRFGYNLVEQAERLNGINQQSAVVHDPAFFQAIPAFNQLPSTAIPTVYRMSSDLRAPYTMQTAVSVERQITKVATISVTYLNSRGEHALFIRNAGATASGASSNIYEYDSEGIFRQNQLIANARVSAGKKLSLFGFYTLGYANSNAASGGGGAGFFGSGLTSSASFVSNSLDPMADYGRAAFDVRHRGFIGGNVSLPHAFSLSPFVIINSGQPYNLTTGQDNNGDSIFNDRPWLATATNVDCRSRGSFAVQPTAAGLAPINYCTGRGNATLNLRLSKTFGLGPQEKGAGGAGGPGMRGPRMGGPGGLAGRGLSSGGGNPFGGGPSTNRRYNLTFAIMARNVLNSLNPGPPVGNLSSPNFGQSISIAGGPFSSGSANRRVDLQVMFSF